MIRKSAIKSAFESLVRLGSVYTPFGVFPALDCCIRIIAVGCRYTIALYKCFLFNGDLREWVCLRSFPMSYKSAYRLVCSL